MIDSTKLKWNVHKIKKEKEKKRRKLTYLFYYTILQFFYPTLDTKYYSYSLYYFNFYTNFIRCALHDGQKVTAIFIYLVHTQHSWKSHPGCSYHWILVCSIIFIQNVWNFPWHTKLHPRCKVHKKHIHTHILACTLVTVNFLQLIINTYIICIRDAQIITPPFL